MASRRPGPRRAYTANVPEGMLLALRPVGVPETVPGASSAELDEQKLEQVRALLAASTKEKARGEQAYVSATSALIRFSMTAAHDVKALRESLTEQIHCSHNLLDLLEQIEKEAQVSINGKAAALLARTSQTLVQAAQRGDPYLPDLGHGERTGAAVDPLEYGPGTAAGLALKRIIERRLQVLETALAALDAKVGRPEGGPLDPLIGELARLWTYATGRPARWRKEAGEVTGPFPRFCTLAIDCLPPEARKGASVSSAIQRVCDALKAAKDSGRTPKGATSK